VTVREHRAVIRARRLDLVLMSPELMRALLLGAVCNQN
jgi:hypothetical protein